MGCDIHAFIEKQIKPDGHWQSRKEELYIGRDYDLFALLADVRNYHSIPAIALPKGIPNNSSQRIQKEYARWDSDAHSASYLTASALHNQISTLGKNKIESLLLSQTASWVNWVKEPLIPIYEALIKYHPIPEQVRLVFWFDN